MEQQGPASRTGRKRKLEEAAAPPESAMGDGEGRSDSDPSLLCDGEVRSLVDFLSVSSKGADQTALRRAVISLAQLATDENMIDLIVKCGAIPPLVRHLQAPSLAWTTSDGSLLSYDFQVERTCALTLGLLAAKSNNQELILDAGALAHLVDLLQKSLVVCETQSMYSDIKRSAYDSETGFSKVYIKAVNGVVRRAADAITNLAHDNNLIKTYVRLENGMLPLVKLLESTDCKVQRAAAGALRTLAFKNEENKNEIVKLNALPTLILMLHSEDASIHYEAVGAIGNLVHSSPYIKKEVLLAGALQPVIRLLSSCCTETQREAALLIGQFAAADSDCKVHIVQRGAVQPLINMLQSPDIQLKEMSAFALGRLAQDAQNQVGIAHNGGLVSLLTLLDSKSGALQHNAAFVLYGLAENEDNVSDFIKVGGVQKLQNGEFSVQATKDCVAKTLKRIEEKIHGRVLRHLLYLMNVADKVVQTRVALALAHLCSPDDQRTIFIYNNGLELLLGLLGSLDKKQQKDGSLALYKLATKAISLSPILAAPSSPRSQVYLGEQFVNSPTLSDVTFLVEGKEFYAHRIALVASSEAFRAMFDGGYCEKEAREVEIPNIKLEVFELMMRYIYTGSVEVTRDVADELLGAADQYLLEGLKRLCECTIAQDISAENIVDMYELSEACNGISLRQECILFILKNFAKIISRPRLPELIQRMIPEIRSLFVNALKPA